MKIGEILALTGQVHDEDFDYDKVLVMYIGGRSYADMLKLDSDDELYAVPVVAAALGMNLEEKRIVDIAVHPYFRKFGFGRAIVNLAVKEYDVEFAYTVDEEADAFWKAIGWTRKGIKTDKGTVVGVWVRPE